jgi:glycosyltransferase involved in cell wall biosynthesis
VHLERELVAAAGPRPIELVRSVCWEDEAAVAAEVGRFAIGLAPFRNAEGASFKTIQYLAAGVVPIVEAGGEAEAHARAALGADAIVVPTGDTRAVSEALRRLDDTAVAQSLSRGAMEAARRLFSHKVAAARVDEVLRDALAAPQ